MPNRLTLDSISGSRLELDSIEGAFLTISEPTMAQQISDPVVRMQLTAKLQNLLDGNSVTAEADQGVESSIDAISSGTGDDQFDWIWHDTDRTLTSGNNEDLDLYDLGSFDIGAGAGADALGQTPANAEIVGIYVENDAASAGTLVFGGNGTTAAWNSMFNGSDTAALSFPADARMLVYAPKDGSWAVADTTNHLLRLAASGGNVTYTIAVAARSA